CSSYFFLGFTAALSVAPAEKRGVLEAAILIASPVAGLRPLRAARFATEKVPKPVMPTVSPFFKRSVTISMRVLSALLAAVADMSVRLDNSATSSPFFIRNTPEFNELEDYHQTTRMQFCPSPY